MFDTPTLFCMYSIPNRLFSCGVRFSDDLQMRCFSFWRWTQMELLQRKSARCALLLQRARCCSHSIVEATFAQEAMACGLSPDRFVFSNRDLSANRCEILALLHFAFHSRRERCIFMSFVSTGSPTRQLRWPICSWTIPELARTSTVSRPSCTRARSKLDSCIVNDFVLYRCRVRWVWSPASDGSCTVTILEDWQ